MSPPKKLGWGFQRSPLCNGETEAQGESEALGLCLFLGAVRRIWARPSQRWRAWSGKWAPGLSPLLAFHYGGVRPCPPTLESHLQLLLL